MEQIDQSRLLAYQLAQFRRSSHLRVWQLIWQFAAALPALISVFIDDELKICLFFLAFLSTLFAVTQVTCSYRCYKMRSAAHAVRRRALLSTFLPLDLNQSELVTVQRYFLVSEREAKDFWPTNYYDNSAGTGRLGLLHSLQESTLYSEYLHERSADFLLKWFLVPLCMVSLLLVALSPLLPHEGLLLLVRLWLLLVVLFLSVDLFGAYVLHRTTASELSDLHLRLAAIDENGSDNASLFVCMLDYCSALEAAPEIIPGIFCRERKFLSSKWQFFKKQGFGNEAQ